MKTIVITLLFGAFIFLDANSQSNRFNPKEDTLTFSHRTGGNIDTFDLTYAFPISTLPGGIFSDYPNTPSVDFYRTSPSLFQKVSSSIKPDWKISGLPHIGFFYSFGTKGIQFLHADYQQVFKNKSLLNVDINRNSSSEDNAMVRNGGFSNQSFKGAYRFGTNKLNGYLIGKYSQYSLSLNGGITNDTNWIVQNQNIGFAPVFKANASSIQKMVDVIGELKYNFLKDSANNQLGIITKHNFSIWNREYNESDTLGGIYSSINLDSVNTRDQFQDAKLKNSIGLYGENRIFKSSLLISHRYWRFQNLGVNKDTNEISTEFNFSIKKNKLQLETVNYLNILGANNEFSSTNNAKWGGKYIYLSGAFTFESLLPSLVQRNYFSNNLNYSNALNKQDRIDLSFTGSYLFWKIDGALTVGTLSWNNNLIWENNNWKIGSESNQSIRYLKTKIHFDFDWLQIYPELTVTSGSKYIPTTVLSSRILFKKRVFAAKKLELMFALDPKLNSTYQLMSYNTLLDNWYYDSNNRVGGQVFSLHSTFALHIEEFKFFIRTENLQAFWTERNIEIAQNYYRPTFLLRLGISWDFFN